jgi:pilus assembly protein Flp/PilA
MLTYLYALITSRKGEKGQDLSEYALLIAFIAIVVVAGVTIFGNQLLTWFTNLASSIGLIAGGGGT